MLANVTVFRDQALSDHLPISIFAKAPWHWKILAVITCVGLILKAAWSRLNTLTPAQQARLENFLKEQQAAKHETSLSILRNFVMQIPTQVKLDDTKRSGGISNSLIKVDAPSVEAFCAALVRIFSHVGSTISVEDLKAQMFTALDLNTSTYDLDTPQLTIVDDQCKGSNINLCIIAWDAPNLEWAIKMAKVPHVFLALLFWTPLSIVEANFRKFIYQKQAYYPVYPMYHLNAPIISPPAVTYVLACHEGQFSPYLLSSNHLVPFDTAKRDDPILPDGTSIPPAPQPSAKEEVTVDQESELKTLRMELCLRALQEDLESSFPNQPFEIGKGSETEDSFYNAFAQALQNVGKDSVKVEVLRDVIAQAGEISTCTPDAIRPLSTHEEGLVLCKHYQVCLSIRYATFDEMQAKTLQRDQKRLNSNESHQHNPTKSYDSTMLTGYRSLTFQERKKMYEEERSLTVEDTSIAEDSHGPEERPTCYLVSYENLFYPVLFPSSPPSSLSSISQWPDGVKVEDADSSEETEEETSNSTGLQPPPPISPTTSKPISQDVAPQEMQVQALTDLSKEQAQAKRNQSIKTLQSYTQNKFQAQLVIPPDETTANPPTLEDSFYTSLAKVLAQNKMLTVEALQAQVPLQASGVGASDPSGMHEIKAPLLFDTHALNTLCQTYSLSLCILTCDVDEQAILNQMQLPTLRQQAAFTALLMGSHEQAQLIAEGLIKRDFYNCSDYYKVTHCIYPTSSTPLSLTPTHVLVYYAGRYHSATLLPVNSHHTPTTVGRSIATDFKPSSTPSEPLSPAAPRPGPPIHPLTSSMQNKEKENRQDPDDEALLDEVLNEMDSVLPQVQPVEPKRTSAPTSFYVGDSLRSNGQGSILMQAGNGAPPAHLQDFLIGDLTELMAIINQGAQN